MYEIIYICIYMYILASDMDGSCELIASITSKDALIILLFRDVVINQHKEAVEIIYWKVAVRRAAYAVVAKRAELISSGECLTIGR